MTYSKQKLRRPGRAGFGLVLSCMLFAGSAYAQDEELPSRVPATGLAILDCAPARPAPENSCVVRVPSNKALKDLGSKPLTDKETSFRIVRTDGRLPAGVTISSTLILVDLSKGPNNGRVGQWPVERAQIKRIVEGLPENGEVAVYGFGADLQRQSSFSDSRADAADAIAEMELTQNNTILSSNVASAIELLADRDNAILKNLIIISDGDEEGVGDTDAIGEAAATAGVTLSAVGMFWRTESNTATSRGIDVLNRITAPQNGLMQPVFLRDRASVAASVDDFSERYADSISDSGLILPDQDSAGEAQITVKMDVPVTGASNETREEVFVVKFTPSAANDGADSAEENADGIEEDTAAPDESKIFGFDALYVYAAAGSIVFLLLLLLLLLVRRSRQEDDDQSGVDDLMMANDGTDSTPTRFEDEPTPAVRAAPAPKPVSAYLVRIDSGERLPIRGNRIAVGRSSTNGITMPDHGISRVHAELSRNGEGGFSLTDMDSLNGTFVNEKKVTGTVVVKIGDVLGFGKVRAKLVLP